MTKYNNPKLLKCYVPIKILSSLNPNYKCSILDQSYSAHDYINSYYFTYLSILQWLSHNYPWLLTFKSTLKKCVNISTSEKWTCTTKSFRPSTRLAPSTSARSSIRTGRKGRRCSCWSTWSSMDGEIHSTRKPVDTSSRFVMGGTGGRGMLLLWWPYALFTRTVALPIFVTSNQFCQAVRLIFETGIFLSLCPILCNMMSVSWMLTNISWTAKIGQFLAVWCKRGIRHYFLRWLMCLLWWPLQ